MKSGDSWLVVGYALCIGKADYFYYVYLVIRAETIDV